MTWPCKRRAMRFWIDRRWSGSFLICALISLTSGSYLLAQNIVQDENNDPLINASNDDSKSKTLDLTFDDLTFDMEKGSVFKRSMLTDQINGYHGAKIRLRGFIRPSFSQKGITKFVFVRDNKECCFGPGAALYDCVLVRLAKGMQADFTVYPVVVEGKFYLKEYKGPDGKVWSIYRMKEGRIK